MLRRSFAAPMARTVAAAALPRMWAVARVSSSSSSSRITNTDLSFRCPLTIADLQPMPSDSSSGNPTYFCGMCQHAVHTVRTQAEKEQAAREGKCVVFASNDVAPGATVNTRVALVVNDVTASVGGGSGGGCDDALARGLRALDEIRSTIGPYDWHALYQGSPVLTEKQEFKPEWRKYIEEQQLENMLTVSMLLIYFSHF